MADAQASPRAKRAVSTARAVAVRTKPALVTKRPAARAAPAAPQDPTPSRQPGFRVPRPTPIVVDDDTEEPGTNYALRLTEALDAISSAQNSVRVPGVDTAAPRKVQSASPSPAGVNSRFEDGADPVPRRPPSSSRPATASGRSTLARLGQGFANLPPIRLPLGPPIPWRIGLPALVVLLVVTVFVARPLSQADSQVSRLPTPATYPVQQEAPLFTDAQPTPAPTPVAPLGVPDPGGVGFDVLDLGLKLVAVLALAYGSLVLLKRTGMGGVAAIKTGARSSGMQVVSSLTLAPNRTVHLLKVPGGKTVLVGATPNQVNLIVDLGELPEDPDSDAAGSFFDILKGKLPQ